MTFVSKNADRLEFNGREFFVESTPNLLGWAKLLEIKIDPMLYYCENLPQSNKWPRGCRKKYKKLRDKVCSKLNPTIQSDGSFIINDRKSGVPLRIKVNFNKPQTTNKKGWRLCQK